MKSKISIIMSCYNESISDLRESVESILSQSYQNFEFIIVNDNPNNIEIINFLKELSTNKKVKILYNEKNLGLARSLNKAIEASSGEYIARMDADDISMPSRLEKQIEYLESHINCSAVASNRSDIDENSHIIKELSGIIVADKILRQITKYGSIITHPTIMIRACVLKSLGGYRPFPSAQDYDLWLRMLSCRKRIHILPEVLLKYRIRPKSITKSDPSKQYYCNYYAQELYKERLKTGSDSFDENFLLSIINSDLPQKEALKNQYYLINQFKQQSFCEKTKTIISILKDCIFFYHNRINLTNQILIKLLIASQKLIKYLS